MQVIYSVVTATNNTFDMSYNIETVIPYNVKSIFIVRGTTEAQCLNKICNYFKALYFHFNGKIETCIKSTNHATIILSQRVDDEYYCRAINIYTIKTVTDEIYYL